MRLLHLTDLHVGVKHSASQENALASLVDAIALATTNMTIDAVLLGGDIAFSGNSTEYDTFTNIVLDPLRNLTGFQQARIIAVPGNHDIACNDVDPVQWKGIGNERRQHYFEETTSGVRVRAPRAKGFSAYTDFVRKNAIFSPQPGEEVSAQITLNSQNNRTQFICTNTAFFSDKDPGVDEYEALPAPTPSLRSRFREATDCDTRVVLGHHPIGWFQHEDREPLKSLLVDQQAIYVHGHEHEIQARIGPKGLLSLGFGAAYQDKLDPDQKGWYRNSFAIIEVSNALHVAFHEWDTKNGRWILTTSLPSEFQEHSNVIEGAHALPLAKSKTITLNRSTSKANEPRPQQIYAPEALSADEWKLLLTRGHLVDQRDLAPDAFQQDAQEGPVTFIYRTLAGRHMVRCSQSRTETITQTQVESWNNTIDYKSLQSLTVISFGNITEEAKTSYLRLSERKPLRILLGKDIAVALGRVLARPQVAHLTTYDTRNVSASIILHKERFLVLIQDKDDKWFEIVDETGQIIDASHAAVRDTRAIEVQLQRATYSPKDPGEIRHEASPSPTSAQFDRDAYLSQCYSEFNSARYTALAAIGIRLPELPLDALYVQATAESGEQAGQRAALSRSIEDMLDRLGLKGALRYELESELKRNYGLGPSPGTSGARVLYQTHGAICVQGDPGSGKTCFVKSEMLAYCKPPQTEAAWYSKHVPIYVPLSEAVRRHDGSVTLMVAAADSAAGRGLPLRSQDLERLFKSGEVAFFFDGLDEIVSIELRSKVVTQIADLLRDGQASGNRFVVTTRPAAAQVVELPSQLKDIHLCGLNPDEQRALARRVLAARISEESGEFSLERASLSGKDEAIATQIIDDVRQNTGLRRLATNPLFLTLLVFIYANSGRPSARRHKVYAEAVRTLAIVRSRIAGHHVISEGDLRQRIGALALHMFRDNQSSIVTRGDAIKILRVAMESTRASSVSELDAQRFLQEVAESTGLLVISNDGVNGQSDAVTFMHQSFLDYFAAIGLAASNYVEAIQKGLADEPRWREVLELLCGIVNDYTDVSPAIAALLQRSDPAERVTLAGLLTAFDCALECDVPPEQVQQLLLDATMRAAQDVVLRHDPRLRERVAERLGRLSGTTASPMLVQFLVRGLESRNAWVAAFFAETLGHVAQQIELTSDLLSPFKSVCGRREVPVLIAVCGAIVKSTQLRSDEAFSAARAALQGAVPARLAAARAASSSAPIANRIWAELLVCMRSSNGVVASACADAILVAGVHSDSLDDETERILVDTLRRIDGEFGYEQQAMDSHVLQRSTVDDRLSSPELQKRLLAIRMLPLLSNEDTFVAGRIRSFLRATDLGHDEKVAILGVIERTQTIHRLLKVADVDRIRVLLNAPTKDVRVAACRVLAVVGRSSADILVDDLLDYASKHRKTDELYAAVRALSRIAPRDPRVSKYLTDQLHTALSAGRRDVRNLISVMRACRSLDGIGSPGLAEKLRATVRSFRETAEVRSEALLTVAHIEPMGSGLLRFINGFIDRPVPELGNGPARALTIAVERCRRRVEDVRRVFVDLKHSESSLVANYIPLREAVVSGMGEGAVPELREALEDTRSLLIAYREFSERSSMDVSFVPAE
jgi:hypothetical protein